MVIGPNGTGKSTIVCAVALGLGGKPEILGRAKDLKDFVRKGAKKAKIEVEVKTRNGVLVIERRFGTETTGSEWSLNGKKSTERDVKENIRNLNIQVDNLCQFLPQDRVAEFAQMQPPQLLRETERAAGSSEMIKRHDSLIQMKKELKAQASTLSVQQSELQTMEKKQAELEEQVRQFRERQKHLNDIKLLEQGIPYTKYEVARATYKEANDEMTVVKDKKKEVEMKLQPIKDKLKEIELALLQNKTEVEQSRKVYEEKVTKVLQRANTNIENLEESYKEKDRELKRLKDSEKKKVQTVQKISGEISKLEDEIASLESKLRNDGLLDGEGNFSQQDESLSSEMLAIREGLRECNTEIQRLKENSVDLIDRMQTNKAEKMQIMKEIKLKENQLAEADTIAGQKLEALKQINFGAYQVVMKLRENYDTMNFEMKVFEPICLSVQPTDPQLADSLENLAGLTNLVYFVVQTPNDYKLLSDTVFDVWKMRANICMVKDRLEDYTSELTEHELICRRPDAKLDFKRLEQDHRIGTFAVGDVAYQVKRAYGSSSVKSWVCRPARILKLSVDMEKKELLQAELDTMRNKFNTLNQQSEKLKMEERDMKEKQDEISRRRALLQDKKKAIVGRQNDYKRKKGDVVVLEERLRAARDAVLESKSDQEALLAERQTILLKRVEAAKKFADMQQSSIDLLGARAKCKLQGIQLKANHKAVELIDKEATEQNAQFAEEYEAARSKLEEARRAARTLLDEVKRVTAGSSDEEKEEMSNFCAGKTVEELEDLLATAKARADILSNHDAHVVEEYEKRAVEINKYREKVENYRENVEQLTANLSKVHNSWLPELEALVTKISEAFSKAFESIGCAGEVQIKQHEDYEQWGITILVKFREHEKLQPLNAQRQSGGERSVSTIIYLMSLQELSQSPFRVVDEINQGMDPRNERMIHSQIVEAACKKGNSQYFLITPKLLPNLEYHERMKVLVIYNGDHQPENIIFLLKVSPNSKYPYPKYLVHIGLSFFMDVSKLVLTFVGQNPSSDNLVVSHLLLTTLLVQTSRAYIGTTKMPISLPIIDISPFTAEMNGGTADPVAKAKVAKDLDQACRQFGFFYLKGHGISDEEMKEVRELAREFFKLPTEDKEEISIAKNDFARGYQKLGQNITKYAKDWHEAIDLYAPVSKNHLLHSLGTKCLTGKNIYPSKPPQFQEKMESYVAKCRMVGTATMRAMAMALGLEETFFDKLNDDSFWVLRIIGYPPLSEGKDKGGDDVGLSCGEHTDYGCLTILNQDDTTGALQVLAKSGEWINADPIPGAYVINIGDMVNVWTNNIYKSTLHRVIHKKNTFRVSIPFFFEPNFDTVVAPLPPCVKESGGVSHHEPVMYGKHLLSKVSNNFVV
ncbi:Structural maintenance of chromosomes protein 5 [Chytridiales sp. JEL 0842]|nr:Structural maintenance of chromosomes protein 5 [Chytridiales sp. JEL 0842]